MKNRKNIFYILLIIVCVLIAIITKPYKIYTPKKNEPNVDDFLELLFLETKENVVVTYKKENIVIERQINNDGKINSIELNGKSLNTFFISHDAFVNGTKLKVIQN